MTSMTTRGTYTREQIDLLKRTLAKDASDDEFALFFSTCERLGMDPFARQAFLVKRWNTDLRCYVAQTQISVDGFRVVAERTGRYEGQTAPQWCGEDGEWRDVWLAKEPPAAARVGVYRAGHREPVYGIARYASFVQTKKEGGPNRMWATMPDIMLAKCAESQALRKAFPQVLSGVYSEEEMEQADSPPQIASGIDVDYVTERQEAQAAAKNEARRLADSIISDVIPHLKMSADVERFCHFNGWEMTRMESSAKTRVWNALRKQLAAQSITIPVNDLREMIASAPEPMQAEEIDE